MTMASFLQTQTAPSFERNSIEPKSAAPIRQPAQTVLLIALFVTPTQREKRHSSHLQLILGRSLLPSAWKRATIVPIYPSRETPRLCVPFLFLAVSLKQWRGSSLSACVRRWVLYTPTSPASPGEIGATECIIVFLSKVSSGKATAVFLDLEKAYELANPTAILATLATKGIAGNLLRWVRDFLRDRSGHFVFQGCL